FEAVLSVPEDSAAAVVLRSESGPVILVCSPEYVGSFGSVSSILFLPPGLYLHHPSLRISPRAILVPHRQTVTFSSAPPPAPEVHHKLARFLLSRFAPVGRPSPNPSGPQ